MTTNEILGDTIPRMYDRPLVWPVGRSSGIAYVDGVFSEKFCSNIISFCEENKDLSFQGKTMGGIKLDTKVSYDWYLEQTSGVPQNKSQEFDKRVFDKLWEVLNLYKNVTPQLSNSTNGSVCMTNDTGYQIQKYPKNIGFYNEHIDGAPWTGIPARRTLGVIVYLNTIVDGGGTGFPAHDLIIDAVAGRVAVFPASWTHPHSGLMPLSDDKWIISTFVESMGSNAQQCGPQCDHHHDLEATNS